MTRPTCGSIGKPTSDESEAITRGSTIIACGVIGENSGGDTGWWNRDVEPGDLRSRSAGDLRFDHAGDFTFSNLTPFFSLMGAGRAELLLFEPLNLVALCVFRSSSESICVGSTLAAFGLRSWENEATVGADGRFEVQEFAPSLNLMSL
jgi:hypothetical protein